MTCRFGGGAILLGLLCFGLSLPAAASFQTGSPLHGPSVNGGDDVSEIDRLISVYREATGKEQQVLNREIRRQIVEEVNGRQKLAIQEVIKLSNLKRKQSETVVPKKKRKTKHAETYHRKRRRCNGIGCTVRNLSRSLQRFFSQATRKRRHPLKKQDPRAVLRSRK